MDPSVRLKALSLQRVSNLFRFHNEAASFTISTLHLPLFTSTFISHADILRLPFPFSLRWRLDLTTLFSSPVTILEPPLHPFCLLSQQLSFSRVILRSCTKPFGLHPSERFLVRLTLNSLFCREGFHWRVKKRAELLCSFSAAQCKDRRRRGSLT